MPSNDAQPLFWAEKKTATFFKQLMEDLNVQAVCDLTPGSGTLASACLASGRTYFGVFKNTMHSSWAINRVEKDALMHIVTLGTTLYEASFADHVKKHFATTVNTLHEADCSVDVLVEDEDF